jgi:hypothetical protein
MEVAGLRGTPDQFLPSQGKVEDLLIDYHSVFMDQSLKHTDTSRDTTFGTDNGHLLRKRTGYLVISGTGPCRIQYNLL